MDGRDRFGMGVHHYVVSGCRDGLVSTFDEASNQWREVADGGVGKIYEVGGWPDVGGRGEGDEGAASVRRTWTSMDPTGPSHCRCYGSFSKNTSLVEAKFR